MTEGKRLAGWQDNGRVRLVCVCVCFHSSLECSDLELFASYTARPTGEAREFHRLRLQASFLTYLVCSTKKNFACSDSSFAYIGQVTFFL